MKQRYVYVLDKDGSPMMPTARFGKVRRMLKDGEAVAVRTKPFTVRLAYEPETKETQPVTLGIDPGRTNIGLAAESGGKCLYLSHCETRNKEIPRLMKNRKEHRQASRRGERLRRKRRAEKNGTTMLRFTDSGMGRRPMLFYDEKKKKFRPYMDRKLPKCRNTSFARDLMNTEARFANRRREEGWLTPTATQLLRTHINLVNDICGLLPITYVSLEANRFAFIAMEDPTIWKHKLDFQNGPMKGFDNIHDAVDKIQDNRCLLCGKEIEHHHHMQPLSRGGSDTLANVAGLCNRCHVKVHKDDDAAEKLEKKHAKVMKKYGALSVLNQIIPSLLRFLEKQFPDHTNVTTGWETKQFRDKYKIEKTHELDAYCIAMAAHPGEKIPVANDLPDLYEILQFRRHDRARIKAQVERTYQYGGKTVAKNRHKRISADAGSKKKQAFDSLEDWFRKMVVEHGQKEAEHMRSKLKVKKSCRRYNNMDRELPGAIFLYHGKRYVLKGNLTNGTYYHAYGEGDRNFPVKECRILAHNPGLVYD